MASPVFESDGATVWAAANNNNAISLPLPATRPVGSVLLIAAWCRLITAAAPAAPSGYTLLNTFTSGTASGGRMWVYGRICDGTEAAPSITPVGATGTSGDIFGAGTFCYSGVDTSGGITAIWDGTPTVTDASGTTTCTYPALTISNSDSMIVRFLCRFRDAVDTFTPTATWNEREDAGTTNRLGGQHHWQDKAATASGVQAAVTVAPSVTTASRYLAVTAALKGISPKQTATAEISLASATTPPTRTAHSIKLRARKTNAAHQGRIRARLYEGGTARSAEIETADLTTSFAEYTLALTDPEAASISSYANLSIRLYGYSSGGTATVFEVSQLWLEAPAPAGTQHTRAPADGIGFTDARAISRGERQTVSDGFALTDQATPVKGVNPLYTTTLDDFNRANGAVYAGAGGTLWENHILGSVATLTHAVVSGNQLGWSSTNGWGAISKFSLASDLDLLLDVAVGVPAAGSLVVHFAVLDPATGADFLRVYWDDGTSKWVATRSIGGGGANLSPPASITSRPQAGESYWIAKRGSSLKLYRSPPGGGPWVEIGSWTSVPTIGVGRVALTSYDTTTRVDNLRGGPLTVQHKRTVADGFAFTDARAVTKGKQRTVADGIAFTDARAIACAAKRTVADGFALTDARSFVRGRKRTVADGFALTDARSKRVTKVRADGIAFTDARQVVKGKKQSVADGIAFTDARTRTVAWKRTRADGIAFTDARKATHAVVQSDGFALTDARTRVATVKRTRADGIAFTDARNIFKGKRQTLGDAIAFTDARSFVKTPKRTVSDAIAFTDARTRVAVIKRTRADGFALTDARAIFKGKRQTVSDGLALTDARTRTVQWKRTRADGINFTDARRATHVVHRADGIAFTDQATRRTTTFRTRADAIGFTDARTRAAGKKRALADGLALTDQCIAVETTGSVPLTHSVSDSFALTDEGTIKWTANRSTDEQFALTDARAFRRQTFRTVADGITFTDTRRATHVVHRADGIGFTDGRTLKHTIKRTRADGIAFTDQATRARAIRRTRADAIAFTDAERESRGKRISDAIGFTDARARSVGYRRARADTFSLTDQLDFVTTGARRRTISDAISFTDARTRQRSAKRTIADGFALTDTRAATHVVRRADGIAFTDQVVRARVIRRTRADGVAFTDARSRTVIRRRTVSDSITFTDSRAATHVVHRADGIAFTDARTRIVAFRRGRADSISFTDQVVASGASVRTLADGISFTDHRVRAVTWHRTRADGITFTDARARGVRLAFTERITFTDAWAPSSGFVRVVADGFALTDHLPLEFSPVLVGDLVALIEPRNTEAVIEGGPVLASLESGLSTAGIEENGSRADLEPALSRADG